MLLDPIAWLCAILCLDAVACRLLRWVRRVS